MRPRVYIAGPISLGDRTANLNQAVEAGCELLRRGFAPLIPQLSAYIEDEYDEHFEHDEWLECDLPWVSVSDAVLRLAGESKGADEEVKLANRLGIPIFRSIDTLIGARDSLSPRLVGDPRFHDLLTQLAALHNKKYRDYGTESDALANVRASSEFGIPPWLGAVLRANDKMARLKKYARKGNLANESVQDSFLDLASYALIAHILHEESLK